MGRQRRNIKIDNQMLELIQDYLDISATINEYQKRYYNPELAEYYESLHNTSYAIVDRLGKLLNLNGNPDMKQVEDDYDYYAPNVNPQYRKENDEES